MADTTDIWGLPKPEELDDPPDVPRDVRALADAVDTKLTPLSKGVFAAMPPAGKLGQRYIATDQGNQEYLDLVTGWVPMNLTRGLSAGDVKASFQSADHGDWLLIDGRNNIPRSQVTQEFIDLMIARGYPGADGTKIGLPDGVGRVLAGKGTHADVNVLGKNEAEAVATRTPKHKHTVSDPQHAHGDPPHLNDDGGSFYGYVAFDATEFSPGQAQGVHTVDNASTGNSPTGVSVGPGGAAPYPLNGPAYLTINWFIYVGSTVSSVSEGGGGGSLQRANNVPLATANLAAGAGQSGVVTLGAGYRLLKISADHPCRIRLYSTPAKRTADVARASNVEPIDYPTPGVSPNHGCMLEVLLTADNLVGGVYEQDLAPNVVAASLENPRSNDIAYRIDNTDVAGHVINVTLLDQILEEV